MNLAVAVAFAVALVLGAPVVWRGSHRHQVSVPRGFHGHRRIRMVAGTIGVAFLAACARVRRRGRLQFAILLAALALGAGFARLLSTGAPEVDVVERFHFVEGTGC